MSRFVLAALASALVAAGCTSYAAAPGSPGPARTVQVVVENAGPDEVVIELVRSGIAIPLGTVPGRRARSFSLNRALIGTGSHLSLLARNSIGASRQSSASFDVFPGDRVEWVVETRLHRSALRVR